MKRISTLFCLRNSVDVGSPSHLWVLHSRRFCDCPKYYNPKKTIYHIVPELDEAMKLRKKPLVILELKDIIQSRRSKSLLLRDLEKEIGFVRKWDFMSLIEKNPEIFRVGNGYAERSPPFVALTERAEKIAKEESEALKAMEPILVKNLRKLLMLTVDYRVPLEKLKLIAPDLGLPEDFENSLIPRFPNYFVLKDDSEGNLCLYLEEWDSKLAVTSHEEKLVAQGISAWSKMKMSNNGNYPGPHSFRIVFPAEFKPSHKFLNFNLKKWQMMDFPSPYLNAQGFEDLTDKAKKWRVGVVHEILSLTMEKKLTMEELLHLAPEFYLPSKLILMLINHHGIFYLTNKGERSTVILKEASDMSNLIEKCPILVFRDRFTGLSRGRAREQERTSYPKGVF